MQLFSFLLTMSLKILTEELVAKILVANTMLKILTEEFVAKILVAEDQSLHYARQSELQTHLISQINRPLGKLHHLQVGADSHPSGQVVA